MRTIFEDTEVKAELEDDHKSGGKSMPIVLWCIALACLFGTWGVYRWVTTRPAPLPPPPPVSLMDVRQTSEAFGKFNRAAQDGNWAEAEKMLSTAAQQKLLQENKSLRESILLERKDDPVVEAASTPSGERTPEKVRVDCVYKFMDGQYKIIPLTMIMENGKLVINSWWEEKPEQTKRQ